MFISTAFAASEGAAAGGTFPPFDPTYFASQLLWLTITFGIFYFIMNRVVIPRLASILEVRKDRISRDLDEAQRLSAEADAANAAYEHELAEAKRNAHHIALEATEKARDEAAETRKKIEDELASKMAESEAQIASIKSKALAEVDTIAVDTVEMLVDQLIGSKATKAEAKKAVTAASR
ncbi:MAG: F0F1 ATP synthase subunit B [Pseudomonadota bacterium]